MLRKALPEVAGTADTHWKAIHQLLPLFAADAMDRETLDVSELMVLCPLPAALPQDRGPRRFSTRGPRPAAGRPLHGGQGMDRSGRCAHAWSERPPVSCRPGDPQCFSLSAAPVEVAGARHNRRSASAASLFCASTESTASRSRWRRASSRAASVARCERASTARIDRTGAEGVTAAQQHAAPGRDKPASRVNDSLRHRLRILLSSRGECGECWVPCRSLSAQ